MIGLMDCNNFFVSCERLFRPDLLGKPVLVLSSNDGCVVARSQEIKDLGVPMGIPFFEIEDLCKKHSVTIFSSNFPLYRDISARVMSALRVEFDTCEVYSVDEAFFDVESTVTEEEMAQVRARIMQKTGIPVSIGVATTKTLAKVANSIAKKETGVCILRPEDWQKRRESMLCGSVWGIGRQTSAKLSQYKIYTVAELLTQDAAFIRKILGVTGERLCMELEGISVYKMGDSSDDIQQSYTSTRSFRNPIMDKQVLLSALGHHIAQVAEKLREDKSVAGTISIILRGGRYGSFSHRKGVETVTLLVPSNDTVLLTKEVRVLFETLFDPEIPYKKAGVIASCVEPAEFCSGGLFPEFSSKKTEGLDAVTDVINSKFGGGTVRTGVTLDPQKWQGRQNNKSREYTTNWSEIARVKAA